MDVAILSPATFTSLAKGRTSGDGRARVSRLRQPDRACGTKPGETVLDLGSGGGIDVLLSARRVGPAGKAFGLDMTDEMLALARENQAQGRGRERRVSERRDRDTSRCRTIRVDVIISNCVINLSANKDQVLPGSFPCAQTRWPFRGVRRRHARRDAARNSPERPSMGRLHRRARSKRTSTKRNSKPRDSTRRHRTHANLSGRGRARVSERSGYRRRRHRAAGGWQIHGRIHPCSETVGQIVLRPLVLHLMK